MRNAELTLTQEWDKTFPLSDKVDHSKVTFHNRYGITLAADLYKPKGAVANQGRGGRQARGDSRVRPLRRREGAVLGTLCADHGGARFSNHRVRSVVLRRVGRRAALYGQPGYQHRGFHGCGGLPLLPRRRGHGTHWHHRHLRLGRSRPQTRLRSTHASKRQWRAPCTI